MNIMKSMFYVRMILSGWMTASVALFAPDALAAVDLLPNLKPLPASSLSIQNLTNGTKLLRFDTTSWNNGSGPLEVIAGEVLTGSGKQKVFQRVYLSDGSYFDHHAGDFQYHEGHQHFHFDGYALYTIQPVDAPGGSARTGSKTTFCIMDTDLIDVSLPGAPAQRVYSTCGTEIQGMSIGWGDTYRSYLSGQYVDITDNPNGIYQLKIEVDPNQLLLEANENDNVSCVLLKIQNSTITVLDNSGSCTTVQSITPNSASMGTTVPVTITGFGFTSGTAVSFERGNGARPVASNVVLFEDTDTIDTITANVTVPLKKQLGRDPVWDVKVGVGVLPNGFRVTR